MIYHFEKASNSHTGGFFMSECKLDHTPEDVQNKFEQQKEFLPDDMSSLFQSFFSRNIHRIF